MKRIVKKKTTVIDTKGEGCVTGDGTGHCPFYANENDLSGCGWYSKNYSARPHDKKPDFCHVTRITVEEEEE